MVFFMAEYRKKLEADIRCPLEYGLWWQMEIAYYMRAFRQQKLRYSEIRKEMYNITGLHAESDYVCYGEYGTVKMKKWNDPHIL